MLTSLAIIFLVGLSAAFICRKTRLPRIIGMLVTGIVIGPYVLFSTFVGMAAIGSVPLSLGLPCGSLVLSVAVLSILITAPLGAIGMDFSCKRLLHKQ